MTDKDTVRLRAMVAPEPTYPAPWRVAEEINGKRIVTCSTGCYTAECPSTEAAEIIAAAVNEFSSWGAVDDRKVEIVLATAFWGTPVPGNAKEVAARAVAALAEAGYSVVRTWLGGEDRG